LKTNNEKKMQTEDISYPMRLSKFLANAGVASRRKAEELIATGRIKVNGDVVLEQGVKVLETDEVKFGAKKITLTLDKTYIMLNKPVGYVCTSADPYAEHTVYELIQLPNKRLFTVGRLDANSEGLLLLTDDGKFAEKIAHPRYGIQKKYLVVTAKPLSDEAITKMKKRVYDDGEILRADAILKLKRKCEYVFIMSEGKKREIRRLIGNSGGKIRLLRRTTVGGLTLGSLPKGAWRNLTETDMKAIFKKNKEV
jgi:23S rRNA pseudouridine2605 synthase